MKSLLSILLISLPFSLLSQQEWYYYKSITSDDGLPSNYIETIVQDKIGFMWFGSSDGLSRYDGISFLNFRNRPTDTTSLIDNEIKSLAEDNHSRLWIGTQKGLSRLDLTTYKFKWFTTEFPNNIGNCWISSLLKFKNNFLLIGTYGHGMVVLDVNKNIITGQFFADKGNSGLSDNNIRYLFADKYEKIWIATNNGLDVVKWGTSEMHHLLVGQVVFNLCIDYSGNMLVTTLNSAEIYTIDPVTLNIIRIEKLDSKFREKAKVNYCDVKGNRWLSVNGDGLYQYNSRGNLIQRFVSGNNIQEGLSSNSILAIYGDKHSNIWFGTFDAGVALLNKNRKPFIQVKKDNRRDGLLNNQVRTIFQDMDGDIWIGTKSGGMLSKFNRKNFTFVNYQNNPNDPVSLNDDIVRAITDGEFGTLWAGTLTGGINILNKKSGHFSFLKNREGGTNQIASNSITVLYNDKCGKIWIGHGDKGLDVYDLKTREIIHFMHSGDSASLTDNRVRAICRDSKGNTWVGTMHGLNLMDGNLRVIGRFVNRWNDTCAISGNNITCIYEDIAKNIWIGTTNGLNLWNSKTNNFSVFSNSKGFPVNSVRGILGDNDGNLWIGADNGLIKFDTKKSQYKKYSKADGLNSNEFAQYAYCKSKIGEMYFGTGNGFLIFDPFKITKNSIIPNVALTKFKLFNQEVNINTPGSPLNTDISQTREIELTYKQSVFTIEFTAFNYTTSENNQFAYKLEGLDNVWNYIGTRRDVTFNSLPAGKYMLRVKGSNNDGLWNEKGLSLKINILPPPWKTWWAYTIYCLLLILVFLKYRDIMIQKVKAEKEHEIDQMKIRLFMNISHEFRTPLTLMVNPLKRILETEDINEIKASAGTVQKSTWKLLNMVNQLLDFRKLDKGLAPLKARQGDIVKYTKQICQLFKEVAGFKEIKFEIVTSLEELKVWLDADKYEKILNNLLSNAFKFTENGGSVTIYIDTVNSKNRISVNSILKRHTANEFVEIRVVDTGIGISAKDIRNIFDRFYQADQSKTGTGIGLNYVKNLVELHCGEVLVESEPGKGSCFIIRIPIGDAHLKEDQKDTINKGFEEGFDKVSIESLLYDIESVDTFPISDAGKVSKDMPDTKLILIVEDNKVLRKQICEELKTAYVIKEASNGEEGLEKALKYIPDLIISDVMMPKMDGIELCRKIKTDLNTSHIPLILLTAKNSIESKMEGYETGADEYIPKPFSMELLEVRIRNLINIRIRLKEKFSTSKLLDAARDFTTNNLDEAFIEKATKIVIENIENIEFSLSDLCLKLGMSSSNLFKKINAITGQNPSGFVRTIRLKYSVKLLIENNLSVKDVCYQCGFNSPAYYIKSFKEIYGQTPKEYVENYLRDRNN
jgi:signal transduction histidine kinase/ligand-binding sensor domain-containing protein/DNA-binding response OmpR family regulator